MYLTILLICTHPHTLTTVSCGSHDDMKIWTQVAALTVPLLHASHAMLSLPAPLQPCTLVVRAQLVCTLLEHSAPGFQGRAWCSIKARYLQFLSSSIEGRGAKVHAMHATAGGGDAYTRLQTQKQQQGGPRDSRITGPIKAKLPALRPPTPPSKIEGLVVPAHPNQQAHMGMLLNQQPGKLMLTDIQVLRAILLVYTLGACCSWTTLPAWHLLPNGISSQHVVQKGHWPVRILL